MIYLKKFSTKENYLNYRDGKDYQKPNLSLCKGNDTVYYGLNANGHPYVDLGFPSGTLWATMNVGASKPSDYGKYFQWGDIQGYTKEEIEADDGQKKFEDGSIVYKWGWFPFTKYSTLGATLELEDDAANFNMGGSWHMPTPEQIRELINTANTTTSWTTSDDGVNGVTFTSTNGKSIFIPAAGGAWKSSVNALGENGFLWSYILDTDIFSSGYGIDCAYGLDFGSDYVNIDDGTRCDWFSVRGVIG